MNSALARLGIRRTPRHEVVKLITALTGDTPKLQLRKLEWAIWEILGEHVVQDSGPRYESAEFLAAALYVAGAVVND